MTAHGRPRKRQRTTAREEPIQPVRTEDFGVAVRPLLERLLSFRSQVVASRDEENARAAEIQERFDAREAASRAVASVIPPPPSEDIAVFSRGVRVEAVRRQPEIPKVPPLPAMKLLMEQDPPEKLIHEQSIIVRAQAINRKNAELARERLPKQPEAQRNKTFHDYFLDEVLWMAADFREERKWKIQMAKKVSKGVLQYHSQRAQRETRAKVEAHQRLVKLANAVARDVRKFWNQIGEIAEYRSSLVEEAKLAKERKSQLNSLLERTAKYSSVLARSLNNPSGTHERALNYGTEKQVSFNVADSEGCNEDSSEQSAPEGSQISRSPSEQDPEPQSEDDSEVLGRRRADVEMDARMEQADEIDDETTLIAAEEEDVQDQNEIQNLEGEASRDLEELLRSQGIDPAAYKADNQQYLDSDDDASVSSEEHIEAIDDERTIQEAEQGEEHDQREIQNLKEEAKQNVLEILKSQGIDPAAYEADMKQYTRSDSENSETGNGVSEAPSVELDSMNGLTAMDAEVRISEPTSGVQEPMSVVSPESSNQGVLRPGEAVCSAVGAAGGGLDSKQGSESFHPEHSIADAVRKYRARGEPVDRRGSRASRNGVEKSVSFAERRDQATPQQPDPARNPASVASNATTQALRDIRVPSELLKGTLRDYQRTGMNWLISLYNQNLNGILADEMGLGKTIQTISLLAWLAVEKGVWGPHLIVVPTSVLVNWEVEFKKWLPGFKILTYFGSMKERKLKRQGWTRPNTFHVCITSYTLAVQDATALRRKKWIYLVLDEAHNIKNFESQRWQTLLSFPSQRRLLITGTPLQNSVMELWSLMHFLMPDLFQSHSEFKDWFSKPVVEAASEDETRGEKSEIVANLHDVLRPFLLRRLKADVEKGLPPKHEHIVKCPLSKRQRQLYEDFMSRSDIRDTLQTGDFFSVMNILMQLRKVCNHPDLFEGRQILSPFAMPAIFYPVPTLVTTVFVKPPEKAINLDLLCLDLCSLECGWPGRWHSGELLNISAEPCIRRELLNLGDSDSPGDEMAKDRYTPVRAASDRAIAFRRSQLRYQAQLTAMRIRQYALLGEDLRTLCKMTPSSLADALRCDHTRSTEFLPDSTPLLLQSMSDVGHLARPVAERFVCCITRVSAPSIEFRYRDDDMFQASLDESFSRFNRKTREFQNLFRPFEVRSKVTIPDTRLIQWDCGKLQVLDRLLRKLRDVGSRVLIFTQMTKVLDILESFLNLHSLRYLRLDGTTKTDDRQKVVERFNTDARIFCMILTTRAGGVGLNLTGADAVIFYDTDYNPAIDNQAQDRAHRIGQTKPVNIYRLVSEQTVEENILRRANEKRSLESLVISGAGFTTEAIAGQDARTSSLQPAQNDRQGNCIGEPSSRQSPPQRDAPVKNGMTAGSNGAAMVSRPGTAQTDDAQRAPRDEKSIESGKLTVSTSYGQFTGFDPSDSIENESGAFRDSMEAVEYQEVTSKLLAAEDDRERIAAFTAEQEERALRAEFDESPSANEFQGAKGEQGNETEDGNDVESSLNPVQRYALRLIERWRTDPPDHEEPEKVKKVVEWASEFNMLKLLEQRKEGQSNHAKSSDGIVQEEEFQDDAPEIEIKDDEEDVMFYEMDISANGQKSYLKGLTDTDADIKMYLPLRDGGPEELKVSTVVSGTAAAGLECAEDAAFFPHAYNRMSRTIYATHRQKEKARANLRKRKADKERKRKQVEEAAALVEKERELEQSAKQAAALDRAKASKSKVEAGRGSGVQSTKKRLEGVSKARNTSGVSSAAAGSEGLAAGVNGLFKKTTKKTTKRLPLSIGRAGLSGSGSVMPGDGMGLNEGWTKEEDQKAIRALSEYSNMSFIADSLSLDPRVPAGLRRRRGEQHCLARLASLQKEAKAGPMQPRATVADLEVIQQHFNAALVADRNIRQTPPSWLLLPTIPTDRHPSQAKVINEARSKPTGKFARSVVPTLSAVSGSIQLPPHFKAGYKPTETTPQALNRKRYPFLRPPRDEPRGPPQRPGSSSRQGGPNSRPSQGPRTDARPAKLPPQAVPSRAPVATPARSGTVRGSAQPRGSSTVEQSAPLRASEPRTPLPKAPPTGGSGIRKGTFVPGTGARMSIGQVGGSVQNLQTSALTVNGMGSKAEAARKVALNKMTFGSANQLKSGKIGGGIGRPLSVVGVGAATSNGVMRAAAIKPTVKNGFGGSSGGLIRPGDAVAKTNFTVNMRETGVTKPAAKERSLPVKPVVVTQKATPVLQKGGSASRKPNLALQKSALALQKPTPTTQKPTAAVQKSTLPTQKSTHSTVAIPKPTPASQKPTSITQKLTPVTQKPASLANPASQKPVAQKSTAVTPKQTQKAPQKPAQALPKPAPQRQAAISQRGSLVPVSQKPAAIQQKATAATQKATPAAQKVTPASSSKEDESGSRKGTVKKES